MKNTCPLCGNAKLSVFLKVDQVPIVPNAPLSPDQFSEDKPGVLEMVLCLNCAHIYNGAYEEELIQTMYARNYASGIPGTVEMESHLQQIFAEGIGADRVKTKKVIEIGASDLYFSKLLARHAKQVRAYEPSATFKDSDLSAFPNIELVHGYFSLENLQHELGQWDFVVARHVFEHVVEPAQMMWEVSRLLKKGGMAYLEVPNTDDILEQKRYYDFFYEHVHYFTPENLVALAKTAGFSMVSIKYFKDKQHFGILISKQEDVTAREKVKLPEQPRQTKQFQSAVNSFQNDFEKYLHSLKKFIMAERKAGRKVAIWGAGCHGITLVSHLGFGPKEIECFIDLNEFKKGFYASVSHVLIKNPSQVNFKSIDTILIVAALHQASIYQNLISQYGFRGKIVGTYPSFSMLQDPLAKKISVVMPAFNEGKNLFQILKNIERCVQKYKIENQSEWILVDNGSSDDTWQKLQAAQQKQPYLIPIRVAVNEGYGNGILRGLEAAGGQALAWTHADCQTDPEDVLKAYQLYQKHAGEAVMVKGFRQNRRFLEKFFSFGMQLVSSLVLGAWLTEINAQPKLFPRRLYEEMKQPPLDFSLDLYLLYLAKKKGYRILDIPVFFNKRIYGEAKGGGGRNRWKLIRRTFLYIFELKKRVQKGI